MINNKVIAFIKISFTIYLAAMLCCLFTNGCYDFYYNYSPKISLGFLVLFLGLLIMSIIKKSSTKAIALNAIFLILSSCIFIAHLLNI